MPGKAKRTPPKARPPIFTTWTYKNITYLAYPMDTGVGIVDEHGGWYGAWMSVESFTKRAKKDTPESLMLHDEGTLEMRRISR